jgi:hypothetical protein
MIPISLSPRSPVLPWVLSLLRAAMIREQASARHAAMGRLDIHVLSAGEVRAWAVTAVRARGPN